MSRTTSSCLEPSTTVGYAKRSSNRYSREDFPARRGPRRREPGRRRLDRRLGRHSCKKKSMLIALAKPLILNISTSCCCRERERHFFCGWFSGSIGCKPDMNLIHWNPILCFGMEAHVVFFYVCVSTSSCRICATISKRGSEDGKKRLCKHLPCLRAATAPNIHQARR